MVRVRFAPSPTGSLHLGSALTAVANRRFADERGGVLLLRIDDTDPARSREGAEYAILRDLRWLGFVWEEGPLRQSSRREIYRRAGEQLVASGRAYRDAEGAVRFLDEHRPTLLRPDGSPTYHLASVVDDADLAVTHVIRGKDHLANTPLHAALARALGAEPPEYLHHGLLLGADGRKLSKRHGAVALADLCKRGIPAAAVRRYLQELGLPRGDVRFDEDRLARLAVEAIAQLSDAELAHAAGVPVAYAPALRGTRTLVEARDLGRSLRVRPDPPALEPAVLARARALRERLGELDPEAARAFVDDLRAEGVDLRSVRLALTGRERGPELWTVLAALPRAEALRRLG